MHAYYVQELTRTESVPNGNTKPPTVTGRRMQKSKMKDIKVTKKQKLSYKNARKMNQKHTTKLTIDPGGAELCSAARL